MHDEINVKSMRRIIVDFEGWKITIWLKPERTILELVKGKINKNHGFLIPEYIIYIYMLSITPVILVACPNLIVTPDVFRLHNRPLAIGQPSGL